jgi:phage terminase small subunit
MARISGDLNIQISFKQRMTCEYILRGMKLVDAMKKAGYSAITAEQMSKSAFFRNRGIQTYMNNRLHEIAVATSTDVNYLVKMLREKAESGNDKAAELLTKIVAPDMGKTNITATTDGKSLKIEFGVAQKESGVDAESENFTVPEPIKDNTEQ